MHHYFQRKIYKFRHFPTHFVYNVAREQNVLTLISILHYRLIKWLYRYSSKKSTELNQAISTWQVFLNAADLNSLKCGILVYWSHLVGLDVHVHYHVSCMGWNIFVHTYSKQEQIYSNRKCTNSVSFKCKIQDDVQDQPLVSGVP